MFGNFFKTVAAGATDLFNKAKSTVSNLGSTISNLGSSISSTGTNVIKNNLGASALGSISNAVNDIRTNTGSNNLQNTINNLPRAGQTLAPTNNQTLAPVQPNNRLNIPNISAPQTLAPSNRQTLTPTEYRPLYPTTSYSSTGRELNAKGAPKYALSGSSGGSGFSTGQFEGFNSGVGSPSSFAQGFSRSSLSGVTGSPGGGSAFTGVLKSTGGLGTPSPFQTVDNEDERFRQGDESLRTIIERNAPKTTNPLQSTLNNVVEPGTGAVDFGKLQETRSANEATLSTNAATIPNDRQQTITQLYENALQIKNQLDTFMPTPQGQVKETPAQTDFLAQFQPQEQGNIRAQMDNIRSQLGLPDLETQRVETMKQLLGVGQAYQVIIDDIKKNPDLPAGLAKRRLAQLGEEQKQAVAQLQGTLDILNFQIEQANQTLNREFDIIEAEEAQAERQKQAVQDNFKLLVDSGAIAGLSNEEIEQWAQATGFNSTALRKLRDDANTPEVKPRLYTNDAGTVTAINENTGEILYQVGGIGNAQGTGGSSKQESALSVLDVQRLQEQYPNSGINFGDTQSSVQSKLLQSQDRYVQESLQGLMGSITYQDAEAEILSDPRIYDKQRALSQAVNLVGGPQSVAPEQDSGGVGGFFSRLFGR